MHYALCPVRCAERSDKGETMAEAGSVVRVTDVTKTFKLGKIDVQALKGVDLQISKGDYISIMGPSGSGKSTLFNMIGGLDKPSSGKVFIDEVDIAQLDAYELAWLRCRKIGYIFQTFNIIQVMTALENVTLPMVFAGLNNDAAVEKGMQLLDLVGLGDRFSHKPFELSGGQQQRVAVARALANDPAIILADEPTGNLDPVLSREIMEIFVDFSHVGVTVLVASHDPGLIEELDKPRITRNNGQIILNDLADTEQEAYSGWK